MPLLKLLATTVLALTTALPAQTTPAPPTPAQTPPSAGPTAQFTPDQQLQFKSAVDLFMGEHYAEAYVGFRPLLAQLTAGSPGQVLVAKYTAEAALNLGDRDQALSLLNQILAANPDDWQAGSLLARFYAETGQKEKRDAQLQRLVDLHKASPGTQFGKLTQILLERIVFDTGSVRIWYSLEPWGRFKTYVYSRVYDRQGQQTLRVTLESSDFDQPLFAKEHPEMAAKGMRRFSMDGYGQDTKSADGKTIGQTHMTFGFYDGQPAYDVVRARIVEIASKKAAPMSKTETTAKPN